MPEERSFGGGEGIAPPHPVTRCGLFVLVRGVVVVWVLPDHLWIGCSVGRG